MDNIDLYELKRLMLNSDNDYETDDYYLTLANYIANMSREMGVFPELPDLVIKKLSLTIVSYYQDIVADAGIWRAFVTMCRHLYNKPVPFYKEPEDYIDYELNGIDVSFVIWLSLESQLGFNCILSPYDSDILRLSKKVTKLFRFLYDEAPAIKNFNEIRELDLKDREQVRMIFKVSGWLFWNSYFMRPVSKYSYEPDIDEDEELSIEETLRNEERLKITFEKPTGPLALMIDEWLSLIVNNKVPTKKEQKRSVHKFYQQFINVTKGEKIKFFESYADLNSFLISKMGWGDCGEECLPQLKDFENFTIYANREKGIIIAPDVAQFIKHRDNPLYNKHDAIENAYKLLLEPGRCPVDLTRYLFENNLLPDAKYPVGENGLGLIQNNWDFFARLYQCQFYRED